MRLHLPVAAIALLGAIAFAPSSARAQATFDFESLGLGARTSLTTTDSGVTMTLTRENGSAFELSNINGAPGVPASYGSRTLDSFNNNVADFYIASFDTQLSAFGFDFGDFEPSDDDVIEIRAYSGVNGTGALVGSTTVNQSNLPPNSPVSFLPENVTFVPGGSFQSVLFRGGASGFPVSLYYDNFRVRQAVLVDPVPEPGAVAFGVVMGGGLLGLMVRRRRLS